MENASKALIMAAEVLISLVIIGALVLMFDNLTSYQKTTAESARSSETIQFNQRYEVYNTDDIRGNDLYSLINKVVDYNERRTAEGEEGQDYKYQPITINVNLKFQDKDIVKDQTEFTAPDGKQRIFPTESEFTINQVTNEFETMFADITTMQANYPKGALNRLATGMTKIFIDDATFEMYLNNQESKAKQIIYNFNSAYGKAYLDPTNLETSWEKIKEGTEIREDVYTYYEYLQFTRAHFKCTEVEYNQGTGRIIRMNFQFTGEIN